MSRSGALLLIATIVSACLSASVLFVGTYLEFFKQPGSDPDDLWILSGFGTAFGLLGLLACLLAYVVRYHRNRN